MYKINRWISWKKKAGKMVLYGDFNYYFFEKEPMKWLQSLIKRKGSREDIPRDFIEYLHKINILSYER
ncbi:MAG: hypothetical protein WCX77_03520 [Candidatus Paceibacterota bacterium]|jgi:hypothetical protein